MIQKWEHEKLIHLFDVYIVRKYVVLIMEWYVRYFAPPRFSIVFTSNKRHLRISAASESA